VDETADGERLQLSDAYCEQVETFEEQLRGTDEEQLRRTVRDEVGESEADQVIGACESDPALIARYLALSSRTEEHDVVERLRLVPIVEQFFGTTPDEGAPDAFTPVQPDQLPFLLNLYERAIVYMWRDDCEPCDLMREELESLFPDPPEDIALFAVYGPDDPRFLYEEYDVSGGPATLFMLNGEVDARLYGAHYTGVVESEIETLRSLDA
jgi:thiol-disulfide isomerase/thioredoxin